MGFFDSTLCEIPPLDIFTFKPRDTVKGWNPVYEKTLKSQTFSLANICALRRIKKLKETIYLKYFFKNLKFKILNVLLCNPLYTHPLFFVIIA